MAYSTELADRVRRIILEHSGYSERKMFGGVCFMLNGNMCCGIVGDELMLRLGEEAAQKALAENHTRPMDFTGKPMKSMIYVEPAGIRSEDSLRKWLERALHLAEALPPK